MIKKIIKSLFFCIIFLIFIKIVLADNYVYDDVNLLSESAKEEINNNITDFYKNYGIKIVIEIVKEVEVEEPAATEDRRERFIKYGLDKGKSNANLLILYSKSQNLRSVVTSEDCILTDAEINEILHNTRDEFNKERYDYGFKRMVVLFIKTLKEKPNFEKIERYVEIKRENVKDMSKYSDKQVFLISDENWQDVLSLVPVAVWNGVEDCHRIEDKCVYPLLIYNKEENSFDADSIIYFLEQYDAKKITVIGELPQKLANLISTQTSNIEAISSNDYFSYWEERRRIIITKNSYNFGLMSAVYASYTDTPLVFENELDYDIIADLDVIVVGDIKSFEKIEKIANVKKRFTLEELQREYIRLTNTDKVILVNPKDINPEYCENINFEPEKSSKIHKLFCKDSLVAPILASAKNEIIISIEAPPSPGKEVKIVSGLTKSWKEKEINKNAEKINLEFKKNVGYLFQLGLPKYLTVIASPKSIPFGKKIGLHKLLKFFPLGEFRYPYDRIFANFRSNEPDIEFVQKYLSKEYILEIKNRLPDIDFNFYSPEDMNVGRIFGISLSDTSSNIARSIFFDEINKNNKNILLIAHDFEHAQVNAVRLTKYSTSMGYNPACYIENTKYNELDLCLINKKPSLDEYENRVIIYYSDHGFPTSWHKTLNSEEIPNLHSTLGVIEACATNDYYWGSDNTFGINFLRKGGVGYVGHLGLAMSFHYSRDEDPITSLLPTNIIFKNLFKGNDIGVSYNKAVNVQWLLMSTFGPDNSVVASTSQILLGDPTIKIR